MKIVHKRVLMGIALLSFSPLHGFNRSLFFRTSSFWDEPRLIKPYLTTFEIQPLGGSNHIGRNECRKKTNIAAIYGPENICTLNEAAVLCGQGGHDLVLPHNPSKICFQAIADVFETDFNLYQNFTHGFFAHFHLPVFLVQLFPSGYLEDHCCAGKAPKHYRPVMGKYLQANK